MSKLVEAPAPDATALMKRFAKSVWLFPAALFVVLIILTLMRISGSSVGMYQQLLYGPTYHDPNLAFGKVEPIRSDEWLIVTPYIVSQAKLGFPRVNKSIGGGADISTTFDLPYKEWSELFKPQNWPFFVLPLEQANAFKWWFMGYLVVMGIYALTLSFLPGKRLLAALLGLSLFFSPFVQWWYLISTLGPLFYGSFIIVVFMQLLKAHDLRSKLLWSGGLAYLLTSFALILYPPYQIPCGLAVAAVCIGLSLQQRSMDGWRPTLKQLIPVAGAAALAGVIVVVFILTRLPTVHAIEGTVYPGHRVVVSGGYPLYQFMDGFVNGELMSIDHAAHFVTNQSEASNFISLWPFLLLPSFWLAYREWRKHRRLDYPVILVNGLLLLFAARLFLPLPNIIAKITLLSIVPHNRLLIGFGFLGFIQLILLVRQMKTGRLGYGWAWIMAGGAFVTYLAIGRFIVHKYPLFLTHHVLVVGAAAAVAGIVWLILLRQTTLAAGLLLIFVLLSVYHTNPLYTGLSPITRSPIVLAAESEPNAHSGGWVFLDNIADTNLLPAAGLTTYSLTYPFPSTTLWHQLDPTGKYDDVYNRYGFAIFQEHLPKPFVLVQGDTFEVDYNPCAPVFHTLIKHVISPSKLTDSCVTLDQTLSYPFQHLYIYRVN